MDSERCWGEISHHEEHDCGPDSGLVLPAVYSLDPAQVRPNLDDDGYHPPPRTPSLYRNMCNKTKKKTLLPGYETINAITCDDCECAPAAWHDSICMIALTFERHFSLTAVQQEYPHQSVICDNVSSFTPFLCRGCHTNDIGCSSSRARSSGSRQSFSALGKAAATRLTNELRRKFR